MSTFYENFTHLLKKRYPQATAEDGWRSRLSPMLVSAERMRLPVRVKTEPEAIVRAFFALRQSPARRARLEALPPAIQDPGNTSVLMSYDFHIDDAGHLRLIEINTNASMSLIAEQQYAFHKLANPFCEDFSAEIVACFREEHRQSRVGDPGKPSLAITDHQPESQRLFLEFLMYQELFERAGWPARIVDAGAFRFENGVLLAPDGEKIDLVYNRHTDFYLATEASAALRQAMTARAATLTPHPHEYRLLADKERLLELSAPGALAADGPDLTDDQRRAIESALIRMLEVSSFASADELWSERKRWFFKPARSFGGKAAYRGSNVTRTVFSQITAPGAGYLAQEYIEAPTVKFSSGEEYKYDLRFYAYRDRIQLACARLYRGQLTNSQTPGGGIAPIEWF